MIFSFFLIVSVILLLIPVLKSLVIEENSNLLFLTIANFLFLFAVFLMYFYFHELIFTFIINLILLIYALLLFKEIYKHPKYLLALPYVLSILISYVTLFFQII